MVRINDNFALKQIVDDYIVVATGDKAVKFSSVLVLNEVVRRCSCCCRQKRLSRRSRLH